MKPGHVVAIVGIVVGGLVVLLVVGAWSVSQGHLDPKAYSAFIGAIMGGLVTLGGMIPWARAQRLIGLWTTPPGYSMSPSISPPATDSVLVGEHPLPAPARPVQIDEPQDRETDRASPLAKGRVP